MTPLPTPVPVFALALGHTIALAGRPLFIGVCALGLAVGVSVGVGTAWWTRRARLRPREQRNWLHRLVRRFDVAILMTDPRGTLTAMNTAAEVMTGWQEVEAVGLPLGAVFQLVDGHSRARVVNPVIKALYKNLAVGLSVDSLLIAKDGTARRVCGTAAPVRDGQGRIFGCALAARDLDDSIGGGHRIEIVEMSR